MYDYPKIHENEFLLGIANEVQIDMLNLFGKKCVVLDSMHGTNQYGYNLTTVLVHDKNHEGLPVTILFSTRIATETFEPFFNGIKEKLPDFKTNVLINNKCYLTYLTGY